MEGKITINGEEVTKILKRWIRQHVMTGIDIHITAIEKRSYSDDIEVSFSNEPPEPEEKEVV